MKKIRNFFHLVVMVFFLLLLSCTSKNEISEIEKKAFIKEFLNKYHSGIVSQDIETIEASLSFIQDIIDEGNKFKINNIYHNKAQLKLKLNDIEGAFKSLEKQKQPMLDIFKITLWAKLQKYDKIQDFMSNYTIGYDKSFYNEQIVNLIYLKIMGYEYQDFYNKIISIKYPENQLQTIEMIYSISIDEYIDNNWPD